MKNLFGVVACFWVVVTLQTYAYAEGIKEFYGVWEINVERTLEEGKKSPKYSPEKAEKMPQIIQKIMERTKIKITEEEMVYLIGEKEVAMPYSIDEESENRSRIECDLQGTKVFIDLILIDSQFMNFKSSGTDDMDYYIWQKGEGVMEGSEGAKNPERSRAGGYSVSDYTTYQPEKLE